MKANQNEASGIVCNVPDNGLEDCICQGLLLPEGRKYAERYR